MDHHSINMINLTKKTTNFSDNKKDTSAIYSFENLQDLLLKIPRENRIPKTLHLLNTGNHTVWNSYSHYIMLLAIIKLWEVKKKSTWFWEIYIFLLFYIYLYNTHTVFTIIVTWNKNYIELTWMGKVEIWLLYLLNGWY